MDLIQHILTGPCRLFFLEGPSGSGKTVLLRRLPPEKTGFLSMEEYQAGLVDALRAGEEDAVGAFLAGLLARYPGEVLCIEDADLALKGKVSSQVTFARQVQELARSRRVVVTGIELDLRCPELFTALDPAGYEYYALV